MQQGVANGQSRRYVPHKARHMTRCCGLCMNGHEETAQGSIPRRVTEERNR